MIGAGWSPKAVQQTLGHASAAFTLTVYGHLFEDDLDGLAEALDETLSRIFCGFWPAREASKQCKALAR